MGRAQGAREEPPSANALRRRAAASRGSNYQERRTTIINAAAALFKEQGYNRTSLADVAQAVGTDRATLYYYFGSKEELLDAIVTDVVVANTEAAERVRDSAASAPEKIRTLLVDLMVSFAANYPVLYVYLQGNLSHITGKRAAWAERMREVNHRWEGAIEAVLEEGIADGTIRPLAEPRVLANGIIGIVGWTSRWYNPAKGEDPAAIGEAYAEIVLGGLEIPQRRTTRRRRPE